MKYRTRIYYTEEHKALMWDRWQKGDSLREIARLFNRQHSSVRGIFERCGGMRHVHSGRVASTHPLLLAAS